MKVEGVTREEVLQTFIKWKRLFIKIIIKRKPHWCDLTAEELFDEIIVRQVPKVVRNCPSPERLQTYVASAADWYVSDVLQWAYHQKSLILIDPCEETIEGDLNPTIFVTTETPAQQVESLEMRDAWSWILYRAHPRHKKWIDAYLWYMGIVTDVAKRMKVSRQAVYDHLDRFCEEAKALIKVRGVPFGFSRTFTEGMEYRGGFCKRCGKILALCQDDYCSVECRKVGPLKRAQEKWRKELSGARVLSIRRAKKN